MTFHWAASWISIPRDLCDAPEQLRIALAHELIHVRRSDAAWSLGERLASVPFAFHPLVRSLGKSIGRFREASCDAELVGSGTVRPKTYAQLLLDMSRGDRADPAPAPALFTRKSNLKHRLELMKAFSDTPLSQGLHKRSLIAASVLFVLTVGSAACGINVSSDAASSEVPLPDVVSEITSRFGPMEDETREAALARLDIQMEYLQERIEGMNAELRQAERDRAPLGNHLYQQYELLSGMYMQRMETYETLKLEHETARRLGEASE